MINQTVIPTYSQYDAVGLDVNYTDSTTYMSTDIDCAVSIVKPIYVIRLLDAN